MLARLFVARGRLLKSVVALVFAFALAVAHAQPVASDEYRNHLQRGVDAGVYAQVAAGWIDAGERQTWFFGRDNKPDIASTFEIGAATEIFTGLLLAQAAYEGKLRLATPIRDVLPKELNLGKAALGATTLRDLATHRAGLPALPPNLLPADVEDPYADYSSADLDALIANYRPAQTAPPAYSTLDAGLLGELLARSYGQKYTALLDEKVLALLGMEHTVFDDGGNLLIGHSRDAIVPHWHFDALAGAAGLRSSVGDLLLFLQQNLRPQDSKLRAALLLARQAQDGTAQDVGLGWNIVEVGDSGQSWPLVWRASNTAGFATFLGFRTDRQQALVLLGNSDADLSALGIAWLEQRSPPPLPDPPSSPPKSVIWDDYPGLYKVNGGSEFIVRAGAQSLSAQFRGQPAQMLRAIGDDVFAGESLALAFSRENRKVTDALVNVAGMHVQASRLSEHAPGISRAPLADATVPPDLAGTYQLDADTLVRIRTGEQTIALQMTARAPLRLRAFAKDRFGDVEGTCEVSFLRNAKGAVSGLVLSLADVDRSATRVVWTVPSAK
jgi:CubicO group peptidase (beta-lactamase class C family)